MDEEIPKTSLLGSRKDQDRIGIKFLGSQHGSQGIEISIDMSGDYFHRRLNKQWAISIAKLAM
jgi:hypothetical protein